MARIQVSRRRQVYRRRLVIFVILPALIGIACVSWSAMPGSLLDLSPALATQAAAATAHAASAANSSLPGADITSPPVHTLWLPETLPPALRSALTFPQGWAPAVDGKTASLRLDVVAGEPPAPSAIRWVYALVAPFPTITDDATLSEVQTIWQATQASGLPVQALLVDSATRAVFEKLWGLAGELVRTLPAAQIIDAAWAEKDAWAIVPFEDLEPRWKVLAVDSQSPLRKEFDPLRYGLSVYFAPQGGDPQLRASLEASGPLAPDNRRADRLATVVVTGVTALVRGTASLMENNGMDYPARDIVGWLRDADILHISNEVSFAKDCPAPFDWPTLTFCSRPKYIQLLETIGTDVVELTGDHLSDWGPDAVQYTLQLYKGRGWKYYGGGSNSAEALQPALFEVNGNKIAFLGCNAKEPGYSKADATTPGTIHCDMAAETAAVQNARAQGYQVIFTFQHEEYYSYEASPVLQPDFRAAADAGAVIVSGSQAHQPHAFEFRGSGLLHYGLGNLFFDQVDEGDAPRTAFIDRHVFYGGKYISTELLTIYFVDFARSRPMTSEERQALLSAVFKASGW
ncbi:MAG TPA: CapA family protein [Anaerolineaceae bacterium]